MLTIITACKGWGVGEKLWVFYDQFINMIYGAVFVKLLQVM